MTHVPCFLQIILCFSDSTRITFVLHLRLEAVRAVLCYQDSVRVPPILLAAACRAQPVALLLLCLATVTVV